MRLYVLPTSRPSLETISPRQSGLTPSHIPALLARARNRLRTASITATRTAGGSEGRRALHGRERVADRAGAAAA